MPEDLEKPDESSQDHPVLGRPPDVSSRVALALVALPFGLLAAWMFWIVHKFLVGPGWIDRIVGAVLDEFILAVGLFTVTLLIGAMFAPAWLSRAISTAYWKLVSSITVVSVLFGTVLLIVIIVLPILVGLGLLK
jgi:hypothetical protein